MQCHRILRAAVLAGLLLAPFVLRGAEPGSVTLRGSSGPLLRYNAAYIESPQASAPWYGRSGFIHPIFTPAGRIITDDFPADHLHQHGLMFAWTSARIDGRHVDFWNSGQRSGIVEHVETVQADEDSLTVRLRHIDPTAQPPQVVLQETWQIRRVEHPLINVFDLVSTQQCVLDRPLKIAEYHYGALCVRGAAAWMNGRAAMQTSEGKDRVDGNHSRPNWVAIFGEVDGEACGLAAFGHPDNFRAPQPVRLHPEMPYFCFAPMVGGDFEITPGKDYVSRFRFAAFDGPVNSEQLDLLWNDFARDARGETQAERQSNR